MSDIEIAQRPKMLPIIGLEKEHKVSSFYLTPIHTVFLHHKR